MYHSNLLRLLPIHFQSITSYKLVAIKSNVQTSLTGKESVAHPLIVSNCSKSPVAKKLKKKYYIYFYCVWHWKLRRMSGKNSVMVIESHSKGWKYAEFLEFLLPYIKNRKRTGNISVSNQNTLASSSTESSILVY